MPLHVCLSTLLPDPMSADADELVAAMATAAAVGFDGVSLWTLHHLVAARAGIDLAAVAAASGLAAPVVEAMAGWANARDDSTVRGDADFAIQVAEAMGASIAVAVCLEPELTDAAVTGDNLALAAAMAADAGITVAVEFLPWSGVPTLAAAVELIERSGADNVGVLLDTWHWERQPGGPDEATLASLDAAAIPLLQISDTGAPMEDMYTEATTARRVPGDGGVDFGRLFEVLAGIGADPVVSPEVFDTTALADQGDSWPGDMAEACRAIEARRVAALGRSTHAS